MIILDALRVLLSPLKYLRARSRTKRYWDWVIPIYVASAVVWVYVLLPSPFPLTTDKGLLAAVNQLLQVLVGFYIAALAAVASLNSVALEQPIAGDPVYLDERGSEEPVVLNRRRFLSLMFAYLSFASITLYAAGVLAILGSPSLNGMVPAFMFASLKVAFLAVYSIALMQSICITLVTLFYLGDRMHRQTPTALPASQKNG
jgi:hypothetical protein